MTIMINLADVPEAVIRMTFDALPGDRTRCASHQSVISATAARSGCYRYEADKRSVVSARTPV